MLKNNWHKRRYKDKLRELEKRAPQWFVVGRKTNDYHLKDGSVTISLTALSPAFQKYHDVPQERYVLTIDVSWSRVFNTYYTCKPSIDFIGEYDTTTFLQDILPIIPEEILPRQSKQLIVNTSYYKHSTRHKHSNKHLKHLRDKLYKERHWYSGMTLEDCGRANLHQDLKKVTHLYNTIFAENDDKTNQYILSGKELVQYCECDCEDCLNFEQPTIVDEHFLVPDDSVDAIDQVEWLEGRLKQPYDRWIYTW